MLKGQAVDAAAFTAELEDLEGFHAQSVRPPPKRMKDQIGAYKKRLKKG